jgi:Zn finger protein HypA/HybF involved in hydrogenase expression
MPPSAYRVSRQTITKTTRSTGLQLNKILSNKVKCLKCNDTIESTHVHDFKWCKCKSIAVDGGHAYLKRVFGEDLNETYGWEDLSEEETDED